MSSSLAFAADVFKDTIQSVAALRALDPPTTAQARVWTSGYYVVGDGGGGSFYWVSSSTAADDGGVVIKPTAIGGGSPGRWFRWFDEPRTANVRWWGAKDDHTRAFDSGFAFLAAIAYLESFTQEAVAYQAGGRLRVPAGTYRCSSTLVFEKQIIVEGDGLYWNTNIYFRNTDATSGTPIDGIKSQLSMDDAYGRQFSIFRNLSCYGDGTNYGAAAPSEPYQNGSDPLVGPGSGHAYAAGNGFVAFCRVYIENCSFQGFKYDGIHLDSEDLSHNGNVCGIRNVVVDGNGRHGWYSKGDNANACVIDNLDCNGCAHFGVFERGFLGNTYIGGQIAECGTAVRDVATIRRNPFSNYMAAQPGIVCGSSKQGGFYQSDDRNGAWRELDRGYQDVTQALDTATRNLPTRQVQFTFHCTLVASPYGVWRKGILLDVEQWEAQPTSNGLTTKDTWCLTHDPTSENVYAGTNGGGVFKSTDQGATWAAVNGSGGGALGNLDVRALVADPSSADVIYAGTHGGKVYKTTDGGTSWAQVPTGFSSTNVNAMAITAGLIYAGCDDGKVYKTTDGGANWSLVLTASGGTAIMSIQISPAASATAIATTDGVGVYTTINTGGAWTLRNGANGLIHYWTTTPALNVISCEIDLAGRMYVGVRADNSIGPLFQTGGIFQSDDNGATFTQNVGNLKHGGGVKTMGPVAQNLFVGLYVESDTTQDVQPPAQVVGGILSAAIIGPQTGSSKAPVLGTGSMTGLRSYAQPFDYPVYFTAASGFTNANPDGTENLIVMDASATAAQLVLYGPNYVPGRVLKIVRVDDSVNDCYVQTAGDFDGDPYLVFTDKYEYAIIVSLGTTWHVLEHARGGNKGFEYPQISVADTDKVLGNRQRFVRYTSLSGDRTVTLPVPSDFNKFVDFVIKDESGAASVTPKIHVIAATPMIGSPANIDGVASQDIISAYGKLTVYNDGTNYFTR